MLAKCIHNKVAREFVCRLVQPDTGAPLHDPVSFEFPCHPVGFPFFRLRGRRPRLRAHRTFFFQEVVFSGADICWRSRFREMNVREMNARSGPRVHSSACAPLRVVSVAAVRDEPPCAIPVSAFPTRHESVPRSTILKNTRMRSPLQNKTAMQC